jgi:hypothetical protein
VTTDSPDPARLPFLDGHLPPPFERRRVLVPPGSSRPYDEEEWRDAIVVVECGEIEIEGRCGVRARFRAGAIIWLFGLRLVALNCVGSEPAVLVAVARHDADLFA